MRNHALQCSCPNLKLHTWPLRGMPRSLCNTLHLRVQEAAGWGVVVGASMLFVIVTSALVYIDYAYGSLQNTSENFNTAGRNMKTGLVASVIVSVWTWAATLLQSSSVAWKYGVSGPFWFAATQHNCRLPGN